MNIAVADNYFGLSGFYIPYEQNQDSGLSNESSRLSSLLKKVHEHFNDPVSRRKKVNSWEETELDFFENYMEEDWDGYNAEPLNIECISEAKRFYNLLPPDFPIPEISPEPNGDISFEWYRNPRFVFSVSISANKFIAYAGIYGRRSKIYGSELLGEQLPKIISDNIKKFLN